MDRKDDIIRELDTLRVFETKQRQGFKARAYSKVIQALKAHTGRIRTIEDIADIPGIGDGIRSKIEEILATGELKVASDVRNDNKLFDELMHIYGVGPAKANDLIQMGVDSLEYIRQHPEVLNEKQRIGLKYYYDFLERIPRDEMDKHNNYIRGVVKRVAKSLGVRVTIVGSYRRGAENSGDIDVLISFPGLANSLQLDTFNSVISAMKKSSYITDVLAEGNHKCMGVCKLVRSAGAKHRRLDLLLTPDNEYAFAMLYFTGSDAFNIACRVKAREKGYSLSEHGLRSINTDAPAVSSLTSEKEILKFIGVKYVPPNRR